MSTFLITQTPFSDVRPIDPSVRLTAERLWSVLRQHLDAEELAAAKTMFADPEPVAGAAATDWYTDFEGEGVPVSRLDAEKRDTILEEVGRVCARIAQVAEALEVDTPGNSDAAYLRAAIAVPDNSDYIYAFNKKAVVVAWGHKLAGAGQVPIAAGIWVKSAATGGTSIGSGAEYGGRQAENAGATSTVLATGGVAAAGGGIGWLAWLLWAIFLVLFLTILWFALSSCSIGSPQSTLAQRLGLMNHCPVPARVAHAPVIEQSERAGGLRELIQEAEIALAEDAQQCRVVRRLEDDNRRALLEQAPTPNPDRQPSPTSPDQALSDEADDRVREAGGQTGEMQVVLQWDGPADLDMRINCSGGSINYNNRAACAGGELDVDANYEVDMDRPVENIHWTEMPPPGSYGLTVRNHDKRGDPRSEIPFTVLVRQGDEERTYNGSVAQGQQVSVTDIVVE